MFNANLELLTREELEEMWENVYTLFNAHDLEITDEMQQAMREDLKKARA